MAQIEQVSPAKASVIINTQDGNGKYTMTGLYYVVLPNGFVGIDNSTGDAWTEDFTDVDMCFKWLRREA